MRALCEMRFWDEIDVCEPARDWLDGLPEATTPKEALAVCPSGDWLLYLAEELHLDVPDEAWRPAALRAVDWCAGEMRGLCGQWVALQAALRASIDRSPPLLAYARTELLEGLGGIGSPSPWRTAESGAHVARILGGLEAERVEHQACADDVRRAMGPELLRAWRGFEEQEEDET